LFDGIAPLSAANQPTFAKAREMAKQFIARQLKA